MKKINLWTISLILSIFVCPTAAGQDADGQFTIATLNVDGLPQKILVVKVNADGPGNGGTARIGKYLLKKGYDLLMLQEDFNYHDVLSVMLEDDYKMDEWSGDVGVEERTIDYLHLQNHRFECDGLMALWKNDLTVTPVARTPWQQNFGKFSHALDEMETKAEILEALEPYTDDPAGVFATGYNVSARASLGCIELKFRPKDGEHNNQYTAFTVAVPLMRVEEMKLIEAEAAGMQDEARGIQLLTEFAKTRDENYEYGTHNEAYYNTSTGRFRNEVWWQRRVELWGEGFATFDVKRLEKGIIRSYEGTNHLDGYQWNQQSVPQWMNLCIVQSETNNNSACTNNPTPVAPVGNSDPFTWE
jgi:hypothetical protein